MLVEGSAKRAHEKNKKRKSMRMNKKRPVDSMRHLKLIKFYKRPIELRQFTGQTVNLPRMKIDLMKKKPPMETKQQQKNCSEEIDFGNDNTK